MDEQDRVKVSFVIPNYQGEKLLRACLQSIYAQETDIPYEIIVVDDGSSDGSVEMVCAVFPTVKIIANRRNQGPAMSKNIGASKARGDFVAFLDNDVELDPHWLQSIYGRLAAEGDKAGACASHILLNGFRSVLNSTGGFVDLLGYAWDRGIFEEDTNSFSQNTRVMYACSAAMLARKAVFDMVGGFDRHYRYLYEDVDLGWRMNACGYSVIYEPTAIAHHHLSSTMGRNGLRNLYLYERNRIHTLRANMEKETQKWIRDELFFHFKERIFLEIDGGDITFYHKMRVIGRMLQALAWNALQSRNTARRRRELDRRRKVHDWELMECGILCPHIAEPLMEIRTFLKRGSINPYNGHRVFLNKVSMEMERGGYIGQGWYEREQNENGTAFRWTGDRASVTMQPEGNRRSLVVRTLMAHPREGSRVSFLINGREISRSVIPNRNHVTRVRLPDDNEPGPWKVELRVDNPFVPQEVLGVEDRRSLGIAVTSISLR
jgi:GT2 family glycosyltransferase